MQYLKEEFSVISLPQYLNSLVNGESFPSDTVILTFDDGFQNFYEVAYPILKKHQLPATCFVITSKVESIDGAFMHWEQLQELVNGGLVNIGSHTVSHRSISNLDEYELKWEIERSKSILEKGIGVVVDFFSYPYGTTRDYNHHCAEVISNFGYRLACTSVNGPNWKSTKPFKLRRTKIEWGDDLPTFKKILKGAIDIWVLADYCLAFLQNKGEVNFSPAPKKDDSL
jgi:peptidoglycan/xylan/chitin deacetylase (PgdA/CDA1 family)